MLLWECSELPVTRDEDLVIPSIPVRVLQVVHQAFFILFGPQIISIFIRTLHQVIAVFYVMDPEVCAENPIELEYPHDDLM